ncbi:Dabb family protein [Dyadobacter sandarakinus]|uniref:Dabb family protein n=2 Tax=Dyadobacter sandarakinus TaxID=2747268 RepID=A0ABX7I9Q3_9BACT|nr:Dabb family protein [Dyadobacter sandarakinus]QRR02846.1 Dabb family protein [Dyadobacter sandarakinus]
MKIKYLIGALMLMVASANFVQAQTTSKKMLRHVVLFKFKDSATPAQVKEVEEAFKALPKKIKEIKGLEWGTNNSPEGLSQGFTHVFFVTFENEAGREVYLPHPDHKAFGKVLGPYLDKVLVVDYWTQE